MRLHATAVEVGARICFRCRIGFGASAKVAKAGRRPGAGRVVALRGHAPGRLIAGQGGAAGPRQGDTPAGPGGPLRRIQVVSLAPDPKRHRQGKATPPLSR